MKQLLLFAAMLWVCTAQSQNLTQNANLNSGWVNWDQSGCQPEIGGMYGYTGSSYWYESTYGGVSPTNLVAQVVGGRCMQQVLCVLKGVTYQIKFKGSRRCEADNPDVPPTLSVAVRALGTNTFTMYSEVVYTYSNTTWNWYNETQNFTIPAGANDTQIYFSITAYEPSGNYSEFGAIIDDVTVTPVPTIAVNGPTVAAVNTNTNWAIDNAPASGVTYNWSFPGATPSSSTLANPTNIQWNSQGAKTVTCTLGNGTCNVVTITQNINITAPLPVDITSFTATEKQPGVELQWNTANEINNDYFIVYKSKDGLNFTEIGRVKSAGIQTGATYKFNDAQPGSGFVYYRLRQVDKNGSNKSSGVVKLRLGNNDLDVNVYPTVVADVLSYAVETPHASKMNVMVTDMSGRKLVTTTELFATGTSKKTINTGAFAKGIYMLTVTDETSGFAKTIKFTKN